MSDVQLALDMYGGPHARHSDPDTSKVAAASVDTKGRCAEVVEFLRLTSPTTAPELAERMTLAGFKWASQTNRVSRRLLDLERKGLARRCGERIAPTGRPVLVYEAVAS